MKEVIHTFDNHHDLEDSECMTATELTGEVWPDSAGEWHIRFVASGAGTLKQTPQVVCRLVHNIAKSMPDKQFIVRWEPVTDRGWRQVCEETGLNAYDSEAAFRARYGKDPAVVKAI